MTNTNSGWNLENTYANLSDIFYKRVEVKPITKPELILLNENLAKDLGLSAEYLQTKEGVDILSGSALPKGSVPIAQAYCGHQFGNFVMLGDGRALLLGEQISPDGSRYDIQLKGSGKTPYSRGGDGRASLGPMLREYIISEAMHHLGIPTTRSLAVVKTRDKVYRERPLEGGVLTRVARSHIRVGTFQYASQFGKLEDVKELADYTITRHYPHLKENKNPYLGLLEEVIQSQARLIAKWQLVGFVHGVMNTDNMSIGGETIDYGPCAYMDSYNPVTKFSSIDYQGRYAYGNQPGIGLWNLSRFAETILYLIDDDKDFAIKLAKDLLENYGPYYEDEYYRGMGKKLGLFSHENFDKEIIDDLLNLLAKHKVDYTNFFLGLTNSDLVDLDFFENKDYKEWEGVYEDRLKLQGKTSMEIKKIMAKSNPAIIPRNYLVEEALKDAVEKNDYKKTKDLLEALKTPYDYLKVDKKFMKSPPKTLIPYRTYCGT